MTMTKLTLISGENELVTFDLLNLNRDSPYLVKTIAGLDAEEVTQKFYSPNLANTTKFYELGLKPRSVVIKLQLNPRFYLDESYKSLRDELYRRVAATRTGTVELWFHEGTDVIAKTTGFVSKFESELSTNNPTVTITVKCLDPFFHGGSEIVLPSTVLNSSSTLTINDADSTAPHGFRMEIVFTGTIGLFTIEDSDPAPTWKFVVDPDSNFLSGDLLYISSESGNKYARMVRSGVTTYLMDKINTDSNWPLIFPGDNTFFFEQYSSVDFNNIKYYTSFWGL